MVFHPLISIQVARWLIFRQQLQDIVAQVLDFLKFVEYDLEGKNPLGCTGGLVYFGLNVIYKEDKYIRDALNELSKVLQISNV